MGVLFLSIKEVRYTCFNDLASDTSTLYVCRCRCALHENDEMCRCYWVDVILNVHLCLKQIVGGVFYLSISEATGGTIDRYKPAIG